VQLAADTKASSELNLAVAVLSGPAGAGKTSASLAIQGKPLPAERESTRGGEGMALVVRVNKEELQGFEKPRGDLNHLQRALLQRLLMERAREEAEEADLACFVSGLDSFEKIAEVHDELEAMGGGLAAALVDEMQRLDVAADDKPETSIGSPPYGGGGDRAIPEDVVPAPLPRKREATPEPRDSGSVDGAQMAPVVEQIQVKREAAIVMRAQQEADGKDIQDGVRTLFFDLGGQPEFWPLVGEFLRE
jgi:hypothetical protein